MQLCLFPVCTEPSNFVDLSYRLSYLHQYQTSHACTNCCVQLRQITVRALKMTLQSDTTKMTLQNGTIFCFIYTAVTAACIINTSYKLSHINDVSILQKCLHVLCANIGALSLHAQFLHPLFFSDATFRRVRNIAESYY